MNNSLGNKKIMSRNIQKYMDENEKTRTDLCNDLGIKYTTLTDWLKGKTYPRIDKIELLADYFHISKSDLVEDQNDVSSSTLTADENTLLTDYRKLNEAGKNQALRHVADLTEIEKYTVRGDGSAGLKGEAG